MTQKIIIRIPNWLGDAVMASDAIQTFREWRADDRIALLGTPAALDVYATPSNGFERIPFDRKGKDSDWSGLMKMAEHLRRERFDEGYLLTNSFSSALLFLMGGVRKRIGYAGQWRSMLLTKSVQPSEERIHQAEKYDYLLNPNGHGILQPAIHIFPEERELARQRLEQKDCLGRLRIGMAVGAAYGPAKRWPPERFAELARKCVERFDAKVLLFGSEAELELAESVREQAGPGTINLAGGTTLREFFSLLQQCRVVVCNDSGAMHAAASLGTPVVALFGSTNPAVTGPLGASIRIVHKALPCAPCFERTCPLQHTDCLQAITTDDVLEPIDALLRDVQETIGVG